MIIFDIETVGNDEMVDFLSPITAPANYKKEESIQKWMDENFADKRQKQLSQMALDPVLSKVKAIGVNTGISTFAFVVTNNQSLDDINDVITFRTEKEMLADFWKFVSENEMPLIGYNSNSFDLPILYWRSMMLGAVNKQLPKFNRYSDDFIDLYEVLKFKSNRFNSDTSLGLKNVCKMLGIENTMEGVDGSQVATMDDVKLVEYLKSDIELTKRLYERMAGVYLPVIDDKMAF